MPDAFALANAFVRIRPEATGFRVELDAKIRAALAGIDPTVKIGASTRGAKAAAMELKGYLDALTKRVTAFRLVADDKQLQAELAKIFAQLASLQGRTLAKKITLLGFARMQTELLQADASLDKIAGRVALAHVDVSGDAEKRLALLQVQLIVLTAKAHDIKLGISDKAGLAAIAAIQAALAKVGSHIATLTVGTNTENITEAEKQVSELAGKLVALKAATAAATKAGGGFGGWMGAITRQVPLFGGAFARFLPTFLASVSVWHIIADAFIEIAAVVIPAAIALGAFGIAAASTISDIVKKEQALQTITTGLGKSFPGLAKGVQGFTDSVKPQVYVLFGEALNTINQHTGLFQKLATGAGQVLDNLGARAEVALGGSGLNGLIAQGVQDLQLLGNIIGNVFGIFGNILKAVPGVAQKVFLAIQAITGALETLTATPIAQWIINISLAGHGYLLWAGLAVTGTLALVGALTTLIKAFFTFGAAQVLTGAKAIAGFVGGIAGAVKAVYGYGSALIALAGEEGIAAAASLFLSDALLVLDAVDPLVWVGIAVAGLGALVFWMINTKTAAQQLYNSIEQQVSGASDFIQANLDMAIGLNKVNAQLATTPKYLKVMTGGLHGLGGTVTRELNPAWLQLHGVQGQLNSQWASGYGRVAALNKITGSQANTLADLNAIGVKAGTVLTETNAQFRRQEVEIKALIAAQIQLAGFTGGPARAAQNALTNTWVNEQLPAIQKITQAEAGLITTITGGASAYDAFELGTKTLAQNLRAATGVSGRASFSLAGLRSSVKLVGAAMGGTSQADYQLNQAFYAQINAQQSLIGSLMQQGISQKNLTKVVATSSEQMLGYAGTNKAARSVIVDLINNALGPGTVTLKSLNDWVGKNSTSLNGMNSIIAKSTIKAGQLNGVLSTTLNHMEAIALLQAHGGQAAWNTFTTDIEKGTTKSAAFRKASEDVAIQLLIQSGDRLPKAKKAFEDYAINGLGLTKKQADSLWKTDLPGMQGEINRLHGKDVKVTVTTPHKFIFAERSGGTNNPIGELKVNQSAKGSKVPGYGGGDKLLYLLEGGEAVVSKETTARHAKVLSAMGVPGMRAGGIAGLPNMAGLVGSAYGKDTGAAMRADVRAALQADIKAATKANKKFIGGGRVNYNPSAGVAQWRGDVFRALSMLNLPSGDVLDVLYQMMTESGGNPNIVNRTDSNWLAGHPSVGLMQVIRGTFDTWAGPYRNTGPFSYGVSVNPMANIYAALNYGKHGRGFGTGPGQIGSGHGYDKGGWLMPGATLAVNNTGRPERVSAPGEPVQVNLTFASSGSTDFDRFMMTWVKRQVAVAGGGSVQAAFGSGT